VVVVLLPVLATRCGLSFEALAAILAAGAPAFLVAAPLFGGLSDRIGRSRVLMLAAGGIAAGQVVFGVTAQTAAWACCQQRSCWQAWHRAASPMRLPRRAPCRWRRPIWPTS
jgi:MFS family permease